MASRRLNKKLLLILLIAVLVLGGSLSAVLMLRKGDPEEFAAKAEAALQAEDIESALRFYGKAIKASDGAPAYRVKAGDLLIRYGDNPRALMQYQQAVLRDPRYVPALTKLNDYFQVLASSTDNPEYWTRLLEYANKLTRAEPNSSAHKVTVGNANIELAKDVDDEHVAVATEAFQEAVNLDPKNADGHIGLARIFSFKAAHAERFHDDEAADELKQQVENAYTTVFEHDPTSEKGYIAYASFLWRKDNEPEVWQEASDWSENQQSAFELLHSALAAHPESVDVRINLASLHQAVPPKSSKEFQQKSLDKAVALLREAIKLNPLKLQAAYQLGSSVLVSLRRPDEAIQVLEEALQQPVEMTGSKAILSRRYQYALRLSLAEQLVHRSSGGDSNERDERLARVKELITLARELSPNSPELDLIEGQMLMIQNDFVKATRLLSEASSKFDKGLVDRAINQGVRAKMLLANCYLKTGQPGAAIQQAEMVREIAEQQQAPVPTNTHVLLAQAYQQTRNYEKSLTYVDMWLEKVPDSRNAQRLRAELLIKLDRPEEANSMLQQIGGGGSGVLIQQVRIYLLEDRKAEAETLLREILEGTPENHRVRQILIQLLIDMDQSESALAVVDNGLGIDPDNRSLKMIKLRLQEKDPQKLDQAARALVDSIEDDFERNLALFDYFRQRGMTEDAVDALIVAHEINPENFSVLELLFDRLLGDGRFDEAEKVLNTARDLDADGANGLFFEGRKLLAQQQPEQAIEVLELATNERPDFSQGNTLLGEAYRIINRPKKAIDAFTLAVDQNPNNVQALKGLAICYGLVGRKDLQKNVLARAIELDPLDRNLQLVMLQLQDEQGDVSVSIAAREQLREKEPENVNNLVRLGVLHARLANSQTGEKRQQSLKKSEEIFNAAYEMASDNPLVVRAKAMGHHIAGDSEMGMRVLEDFALAGFEPSPSVPYRLMGEYFQTLRIMDRAERAYLQALEREPESALVMSDLAEFYRRQGRHADSARYLRHLLELAKDGNTSHLRGQLVEVLAQDGRFEDASKEADEYLRLYPDDADAPVVKGVVELARGSVEESVDYFSQAIKADSENANAYYQRARAYLTKGDYDSAIRDLETARNLNNQLWTVRLLLADVYANRRERRKAELELEQVLDIKRNDTDGFAYRARAKLCQMLLANSITAETTGAGTAKWDQLTQRTAESKNLFSNQPLWDDLTGQMYLFREQFSAAEKSFRQVMLLSKENPAVATVSLQRLCKALFAQDKFDDVIQVCKANIAAGIEDAAIRVAMGHAYTAKGQKVQALQSFEKALAMSVDQPQLYLSVANEMTRARLEEEALARALKRVEDNPADIPSRRILGQLYVARGEFEKAIENYDALLGIDAGNVSAMTVRATCHYQLGHFDEANAGYLAVLDKDPNNFQVLNNLSYMIADDLKRPGDAVTYAERAAELQPRDANVLDTYGWILFLVGRNQEAKQLLLRSVQEGEMAPNRYHLGVVYWVLHDDVQAGRQFENASRLKPNPSFEKKINDAIRYLEGGQPVIQGLDR